MNRLQALRVCELSAAVDDLAEVATLHLAVGQSEESALVRSCIAPTSRSIASRRAMISRCLQARELAGTAGLGKQRNSRGAPLILSAAHASADRAAVRSGWRAKADVSMFSQIGTSACSRRVRESVVARMLVHRVARRSAEQARPVAPPR